VKAASQPDLPADEEYERSHRRRVVTAPLIDVTE
jgi:hypothetical protein